MKNTNKIFGAVVILLVLLCVAASPSFQSFMTSQFAIVGNKVSIKSDAYITNMHVYKRIEFPSASGSSNYLFTLGDSFIISNAQNAKIVAAYGDTADAWFFYAPMTISGALTAPSFTGILIPTNLTSGKLLTSTASGVTNTGISLVSGSNVYGLGSYTGSVGYANQIFASLNASNAVASRLTQTGADKGVTNTGVAVASGSNASGFGTISAGDNITTTAGIVGLTGQFGGLSLTGSTPGVLKAQGTNGNYVVLTAPTVGLTYSGGSGTAASNVNADLSSACDFVLVITNNTFLSVTNLTIGQWANIKFIIGGAGSYTLAFNTNFIQTNTVDNYTIGTAVGSRGVIGYVSGVYGSNGFGAVKKGW